MKEIKLAEFLQCRGTQPQVAKAAGVTQSAISQMARSGRDIRVRINDDGRLELVEFRLLNRADGDFQKGQLNSKHTIRAQSCVRQTNENAVNPSSIQQASP